MKLYYSKSSPFARKVRAASILLGIEPLLERIAVDPFSDPPELHKANPLGLIPVLVTEDGFAFFDSAVICEYLHGIAKDLPIIPQTGAARWGALRMEALGDGLMEAAVLRRKLATQTDCGEDQPLVMRQKAAIRRTLDTLEAEPLSRHVEIGQVSIACGLGYLDFRFPDEPWRDGRPGLAAWLSEMAEQDWYRLTAPHL